MKSVRQEAEQNRIKARNLSTWLLSNGISSATTDRIAELLGIPLNQVPQRLAPLLKRGAMISPARGLWVPVSPEYASWGAPPAIEVIDAMMKHLSADYYVGWLSAAALFGASHHAPQVFQVATSKSIRDRDIGRSRMQFYHRSHIGNVPVIFKETRSGRVAVSAPETTLLDVVNDLSLSGGIDNAANIVIELCEEHPPEMERLLSAASLYPASAIRRLGWLLEKFTDVLDTEPLHILSESRQDTPSKLLPASKADNLDKRWNIYINTKVEADV